MKITIEGDAKEIAALVFAAQERRDGSAKSAEDLMRVARITLEKVRHLQEDADDRENGATDEQISAVLNLALQETNALPIVPKAKRDTAQVQSP